MDEDDLKEYKAVRTRENEKAKESLNDQDVDGTDTLTMVFDIFSRRKVFDLHLNERIMIYFGFLGPILKILRCKFFNYQGMIHVKKIFEKARDRLDRDCDIIEIMDQVRKSKNF